MNDPGLVKLSDSSLSLGDPESDVRGRVVEDRAGRELGRVDDLFLDESERRVRFLLVGSGGILGIGKRKSLIPVEAVRHVDAAMVRVDATLEHVSGAPHFDPELVDEPKWADVYGYYGYPPFWAAGGVYPPIPWAR